MEAKPVILRATLPVGVEGRKGLKRAVVNMKRLWEKDRDAVTQARNEFLKTQGKPL